MSRPGPDTCFVDSKTLEKTPTPTPSGSRRRFANAVIAAAGWLIGSGPAKSIRGRDEPCLVGVDDAAWTRVP
jgi:hypothetical protein